MVTNFLPYHWIKGSLKGKVIPRCERKKDLSDLVTFSLSPFIFFMHYFCVLLSCFWVSLVLCYALFNMFLFVCFQFLLYFVSHKNKNKNKNFEKSEKYKNSVCSMYIGTYVSWMTIETKFSKLCIFCNLDEYLYAQLSKCILWLVFVMSAIK